MSSTQFVAELNEKYFGGQLSSDFQSRLSDLPVDRPDVYAFIERMFKFMQMGGQPCKRSVGVTGRCTRVLTRTHPAGSVARPCTPYQVPGRHRVIDQYIADNSWQPAGPKRLLDLGCGFPPHTTIELAHSLPEWTIVGADPSLPVYLVYDAMGNYCTFNNDKEAVYFQPAIPSIESWNELLSNADATRAQFRALLDELLAADREYSEEDFPRLRIDPVHRHHTANLSFETGGIGQLDVGTFDVIRCFNVMFYFDDAFRQDSLKWFADQLNEGGILLIGANWALSTESRYYVYQKSGGELTHARVRLHIDNFSPVGIVTWYALYDDDSEAADLARCLKVLRDDPAFTKAYYSINEKDRADAGICARDENGYFGDVTAELSPVDLWTNVAGMLDSLHNSSIVEHAIDVFEKAGYKARRNEVGHVAVAHLHSQYWISAMATCFPTLENT